MSGWHAAKEIKSSSAVASLHARTQQDLFEEVRKNAETAFT